MKQTFQKIATIFAALLLVGSMSGFAQSDTLRYGNKDKVALAFREAYDGDIVGAYSKVVVDDVEEYEVSVSTSPPKPRPEPRRATCSTW